MLSSSSRALRHLVCVAAMPLLALPAGAATTTRARRPAPAPVKADASIIPLPLNPAIPPARRLCAARTPSGLGYTMLRPASGTKPVAGDVVLVNYIGYLAATGAVFDQGMRSALPVDGVIPGFSQGLQMMARSSVARFCIPAGMGYGAQASGPIPANSDLVFQVEVVDYKTAAEVAGMNAAQDAAPAGQKDNPTQP